MRHFRHGESKIEVYRKGKWHKLKNSWCWGNGSASSPGKSPSSLIMGIRVWSPAPEEETEHPHKCLREPQLQGDQRQEDCGDLLASSPAEKMWTLFSGREFASEEQTHGEWQSTPDILSVFCACTQVHTQTHTCAYVKKHTDTQTIFLSEFIV